MPPDLPTLPEGWVWTRLGDICLEPQYGWTTSAKTEGTLHLLRTTDITSGHIDWNSVPFCKEEPPDKGKYLVEEGDIVISRAGSVGYSYLIRKPKVAVFASYLIRFKPLIDEQYLAYFLKSPSYWDSISEKSLGIAVPNVNATKLRQIIIPLPPLPEQHRLVAKIDELFTKLDAGVDSLKKVNAQLKRYRQSVLKYAFEGKLTEEWRERHKGELEPASVLLERIKEERKKNAKGRYKELPPADISELPGLPEEWVWANTGTIGEVSGGLTKNSKREKYTQKMPYLRVANVYAGELRLDDMKNIGIKNEEIDKVLLRTGDLLVVEGNGSLDQIGRVALWDGFIHPCVHQNHIIKVRFNPVEIGKCVLLWLLSIDGRKQITRVASSTSGLYTLSISKVSALPTPTPPARRTTSHHSRNRTSLFCR